MNARQRHMRRRTLQLHRNRNRLRLRRQQLATEPQGVVRQRTVSMLLLRRCAFEQGLLQCPLLRRVPPSQR
jgi:hypothetical protein